MPKKLERALMRSARAKGIKPKTERWSRYVYGTIARVKAAKQK